MPPVMLLSASQWRVRLGTDIGVQLVSVWQHGLSVAGGTWSSS